MVRALLALSLAVASCAPAIADDPDAGPLEDEAVTDPGDTDPPTAQELAEQALHDCFPDFLSVDPAPDYAQFGPTIGTHCLGTDHQDIAGVERVVFLGDSITVGTPPSRTGDFYRVRVARELAAQFGLEPPEWAWENLDLVNGRTLVQRSGAFSSCARWGARARHVAGQLDDCVPEGRRSGRTLVVMTIGGNDLASLAQDLADGDSIESVRHEADQAAVRVEESVRWLKEPGRFPDGVDVVLANLLEFTDGTGDTTACPAAALAGFGSVITDPELAAIIIGMLERIMGVAVETGSDMIFMGEHFCGHGFARDDPGGRCYRGAGAELWFDVSCIHPNPTGHRAIAEMVMAVVVE